MHPVRRLLTASPTRSLAVALALIGTGTSVALAQKPVAETLASFVISDEFEVQVFASEPMISNPIAIDVDTQGRVWVTEGTKYRRNVGNPPDDKIKVLEDINGDGKADTVTVFASDLNAAMGVCVAGSKVYVPESPNLYVYEDKDGDLKADGPRTVLLTGFGGKNHDHGTHSQVFGPDHKLYMTNGDTGYDVTGPDGRHIKFQWGGMIRCEADGTQLEDFAVNFRNPVELAVDSFGNVWCSDNDNDGLKSVRICWILEGGNYGWFGGPENIRNADGSFDPIHHWRADKPGFVPYVLITGFGSPCGMTFYEGNAFGPKYQNQIIHCDAGPREIRCYTPQRMSGVGFTAGIQNIVTNTDPYFRPVDPCVAPDGSIYVTDWYDGGVGGHAYNDPERGRIYRIVPKGKKLVRQHKPGPYDNDADALVALGSPNHATLWHARERLLQSGQAALAGLTQLASGSDRTLKARALWLLDRIGGAGRTAVRHELASTDPTFRALAVRILRRHGEATVQELLPLINDADGEVCKEALLAAGASPSPTATAEILKAWSKYDGSDRYLLETLGIASRNRQAEVFQKVVEQATGDVTPRLIDIARILRPEDASRYLATKLAASGVNEKSAEAILNALSSLASGDAGQEVLKVLGSKTPVATRRLALASLQRNLPGAWKSLRETPQLQQALEESLKTPDLVPAALGVIGEGGLTPLADQVVGIIGNPQATEASRLAAIGVASRLQIEKAGVAEALVLTGRPAASESLQKGALEGLVALRDTASAGKLLAADSGVTPTVRERLVDGLMQSSDGAVFLLRTLDTGRLAQPLAKRAIAAAVEHPDVNVRLLFEKHIPVDQRPTTLGQQFKAEDILKLDGNIERGAQVFARSGAAACSKCHRVKGQGADIGPELSQIGRKYEKQALLETIMNPSAGIAPEYYPYVVETDTGKVFAGFLKEANDQHVLLKSIEGNVIDLPRSKVVELVKQEKSLMPELVLQSVTAQDAADLLAYLSNLQESIVPATSFQVLGPFPNVRPEQRGQDFGPEANASAPDFQAQHATFGMKQIGWRRVEAKVGAAGVPQLDIRQLSGAVQLPADNVLYYFAVVAESASAQTATLHIGSDDGVQVWVNGKKVHDNKVTRALAPAQDKVPVELKQGRNLILLKVDQGNGDAGAILAVEAKANITLSAP
jgi:putative membrane-bound dehydrogenase-like protein